MSNFISIYLLVLLLKFDTLKCLNVQICRKDEPFPEYRAVSISVGAATFPQFIRKSQYWSDKSHLIKIILGSCYQVHVITCPRRSGKSINLNMISTFVEIPHDEDGRAVPIESSFAYKYFANATVLLKDCSEVKVIPAPMISNDKELIRDYLGKYPVIYFSFASVKVNDDLARFKNIIGTLYTQHRYILSWYSEKIENARKCGKVMYLAEQDDYDDYLKYKNSMMEDGKMINSIAFLSRVLSTYYMKKVIIFIDEYDHFINQLVLPQYSNEDVDKNKLISFYRSFLLRSFKENKFCRKAVLTGIIKIVEMTGFSNWENGAQVVNMMQPTKFNEFYGFTTKEVDGLLSLAKNSNFTPNWDIFIRENYSLEDVTNFYDGYTTYGNQEYSTCTALSISGFINNALIDSYWVNTARIDQFWRLFRFPLFVDAISNLVNGQHCSLSTDDIKDINWDDLKELSKFIRNRSINKGFSDKNLYTAISLLSFMGYITPVKNSIQCNRFMVRIPNLEIRESIFDRWSELVLIPEVEKTIQNITDKPAVKDNFVHRARIFFQSLFTFSGSDVTDFIRKEIKGSMVESIPENIEEGINKFKEVYQKPGNFNIKFLECWKSVCNLYKWEL